MLHVWLLWLQIYRCVQLNSVLFSFLRRGCDKQDSLMRVGLCYKLHGRPSQLLLARPAVMDSTARHWQRIVIFAYLACIRRLH